MKSMAIILDALCILPYKENSRSVVKVTLKSDSSQQRWIAEK